MFPLFWRFIFVKNFYIMFIPIYSMIQEEPVKLHGYINQLILSKNIFLHVFNLKSLGIMVVWKQGKDIQEVRGFSEKCHKNFNVKLK
jgi:hypothetical protein